MSRTKSERYGGPGHPTQSLQESVTGQNAQTCLGWTTRSSNSSLTSRWPGREIYWQPLLPCVPRRVVCCRTSNRVVYGRGRSARAVSSSLWRSVVVHSAPRTLREFPYMSRSGTSAFPSSATSRHAFGNKQDQEENCWTLQSSHFAKKKKRRIATFLSRSYDPARKR